MSYKLKYTGEQIDDILDRAVEGGAIDDALALKAPLESPALTGTPTAPTPAEGDDSTKVATTEYADRAADAAEAAAEAAAKEYTDAATGALYITDSASGSIASFSDGADGISMRSVQVGIEPIQDLHGQESPYPENGGKNKIPMTLAGLKAYNTSGTWSGNSYTVNGVTFAVQVDDGGNVIAINTSGTATGAAVLYLFSPQALGIADSTSVILSGCASGGSWGGTNTYALRAVRNDFNAAYNDTGSGVTFAYLSTFTRFYIEAASGVNMSGKTFKPMLRLSTEVDATFAPYSNICPIDGWEQAKITRTGKNLLPFDIDRMKAINSGGTWSGNTFTSNDLTFTVDADAGTVTVNGTASANKTFFIAGRNAPDAYKFILPNGRYALNGCPSSGSSTTYELRFQSTRNGALHSYGYDRGSGTAGDVLSTDTVQVAIFVSVNFTANNLVFKPMVRLASDTDATFEPYAGQTFPVTWESQAGEVFGGTIDVVSGELAVTHGYVDLGTLNWSAGSNNRFASQGLSAAKAVDANSYAKAICSYYQVRTRNQLNGDVIGFSIDTYSNVNYLNVRDTAYTDAATFKTAMSGVYLVYELATPVTYHLDSIGQITSLLGTNNVWADCGDTEATYVADPKLYIAKMLGGGALTLGSASPLSLNRPVTISKEDLEQADEVNKAVEAAVETVLPAESGETEEGAQE